MDIMKTVFHLICPKSENAHLIREYSSRGKRVEPFVEIDRSQVAQRSSDITLKLYRAKIKKKNMFKANYTYSG